MPYSSVLKTLVYNGVNNKIKIFDPKLLIENNTVSFAKLLNLFFIYISCSSLHPSLNTFSKNASNEFIFFASSFIAS